MSEGVLVVERPVFGEEGGAFLVTARLHGPGFDRELWFRSSMHFSREAVHHSEAFTTFALLVAMREGWDLRVDGALSRQFAESLVPLQNVISTWFPEFQVVGIHPAEVVDSGWGERGEGGMFCFSGGVDSFHTYLENRESLTHGLIVFGADIALDETPYRNFAAAELSAAASQMGVALVEVDTNLLEVTGEHCSWAVHQHGGGLASIAKMFGDRIGRVLISSSYPVSHLLPWGSFPFTDPLWSGAGLEVEHFGAYVNRMQKVERVAQSEIALRFLRVCFGNEPGALNCCSCEKCLRTMSALRTAGALDRCGAFPAALDLDAVRDALYSSHSCRRDWRSCLERLADGRDPDLEEAIRTQRSRNLARIANREFGRHHETLLKSPCWIEKLPKRRKKLFESLRDHDPEWFANTLAREVEADPETAFGALFSRRRKWLKSRLRAAEKARWRRRWKGALRRLGIGGR